jgi:hypothetical protein
LRLYGLPNRPFAVVERSLITGRTGCIFNAVRISIGGSTKD